MALTELQCSRAKPTGTQYQMAVGDGLSLVVRAKGAKLWRCEYRLDGKKHKHAYGNYPELSLADATELHRFGRKLIELGRHPGELLDDAAARRQVLAGASFAQVEATARQIADAAAHAAQMKFGEAAERYRVEHIERTWKTPEKAWSPIRLHLLPKLADLALNDIDTPMIRELLYDIREHRGVQAALHAHGWARRIFGFATEHDWCKGNPALMVNSARIGNRRKRERWLKTPEIRRYLANLYQADCYRGYKLALHLLLMLALRKNELCGANWAEFDLDAGEWLVPSARMKGKKDHRVFLPAQAVDMLRELQRLGGGSEWVLPMLTNPDRPMHGNNLDGAHSAALTGAGIEDYHIHDHRHTASTQLREMGHPAEVVETALSHAIPGIAGVYAHAQYREQRRTMLQEWADFLDLTMSEKTVIQATFRKVA
ncbi:MAG: tyrosine-type recombinase/integrase [Burkholderiales bacterium]|nr:tyrosine-type recombinase/integrase [Burkholderiales bacterium]